MITSLKQLCCGNCGHHGFRMYQQHENNRSLMGECMQCKSTTIITFRMPEVVLAWGPDADGIMCQMEEKTVPSTRVNPPVD